MNTVDNLFGIWGGLRKMARDLGRPASTVHGWKKEGRIPAHEQPHVLAVALALHLPVTAENIVFPLGLPAEAYALQPIPSPVACDPQAKMQPEPR